MLFSSISFIYYFLIIFLAVYFIMPFKYKNYVILFFSLLFYFLGEPKYIIVLILSCLVNYYTSVLMEKTNKKKRKLLMILSIIYNIGGLLIFKYTDFFIGNINSILGSSIPFMYIVMPIGISFFTFQAMAYVIDVYACVHKPAKRLTDFISYLCLFPQLIAGPIVRYSDVEKELYDRKTSFSGFAEGVKRFTIGLSKKVLLANTLGEVATLLTGSSVLCSWLKPILYTLQIYFDFSGYSDMAIGIGLMIGFRFKENFNYPLIASSITDFWRRWHISLSSWFRDYVYIPLGGNRVSTFKFIRNIFVVWFLTGFWHGASWNFILWGLYFGVLLVIEKFLLKKYIDKTKVIKYIYTSVIVVISFLIFSVEDMNAIFAELKTMFGISGVRLTDTVSIYYLKSYITLFIISIIAATPLMSKIVNKIKNTKARVVIDVLEPIVYIVLLILCTAFLIDASFNPFLYFRF